MATKKRQWQIKRTKLSQTDEPTLDSIPLTPTDPSTEYETTENMETKITNMLPIVINAFKRYGYLQYLWMMFNLISLDLFK